MRAGLSAKQNDRDKVTRRSSKRTGTPGPRRTRSRRQARQQARLKARLAIPLDIPGARIRVLEANRTQAGIIAGPPAEVGRTRQEAREHPVAGAAGMQAGPTQDADQELAKLQTPMRRGQAPVIHTPAEGARSGQPRRELAGGNSAARASSYMCWDRVRS